VCASRKGGGGGGGVRCINGVERERGLNPPSIYPSLLSHTLFTSMVGGGCLDVRV